MEDGTQEINAETDLKQFSPIYQLTDQLVDLYDSDKAVESDHHVSRLGVPCGIPCEAFARHGKTQDGQTRAQAVTRFFLGYQEPDRQTLNRATVVLLRCS